jgi:hypothetical protein
MATPGKKVLNGETDVEDAFGGTSAPVNWKARPGKSSDGQFDSTRTSAAPTANQGNIPLDRVTDNSSVPTTGTHFGPNSRGFGNTLAHNDGWHDEECGG